MPSGATATAVRFGSGAVKSSVTFASLETKRRPRPAARRDEDAAGGVGGRAEDGGVGRVVGPCAGRERRAEREPAVGGDGDALRLAGEKVARAGRDGDAGRPGREQGRGEDCGGEGEGGSREERRIRSAAFRPRSRAAREPDTGRSRVTISSARMRIGTERVRGSPLPLGEDQRDRRRQRRQRVGARRGAPRRERRGAPTRRSAGTSRASAARRSARVRGSAGCARGARPRPRCRRPR